MQVTVGSEWPTSGGGRRSYALTLDRDDLAEQVGADAVADMSSTEVLRQLNLRAEILVVSHVAKEGGMSSELAQQRIRELKNG